MNLLMNKPLVEPAAISGSKISTADLTEALDYLRAVTGIDLPEHRRPILMKALAGLGKAPLPHLYGDPEALARVVHAVSIPETYLFRHPGHFQALAALAAERRAANLPCRVLCAGCATGEEVWSAAAVLAEVYWPSRRYAVEGWDLDGQHTRQAARGEVRKWGARAGLAGYDRFFKPTADGFAVVPELRPGVMFREVNLAAGEWPISGVYDAIFFRNVAIYWSADCTRRVVTRLLANLAVGGLILVGPSDPIELKLDGLRGSIQNNALVYRRASVAVKTATDEAAPTPRAKRAAEWLKMARLRPPRRARPTKSPQPVARRPEAAATDADLAPIREAERLAGAGFHEEALSLLVGPLPPQGRVLAGVLLLHFGRASEATDRFRQAVFLEPEVAAHRRWLALGLDSLGHGGEAERERRIAEQLDS